MARDVLITPASTKVAFTDSGEVTTVLRTNNGRFEMKDSSESSFVDLYANDIILDGNLTVGGTTTTVNTSNLLIEDPILQLAKGQTTGAPIVDIGFVGLRGNSANAAFIWDESDDAFAAIFTTGSGLTTGDAAGGATTITPSGYADFKAGAAVFAGNDVRIRADGDANSHPGFELSENGTRKWIIYNNYVNDNLAFKTNSDTRMVIKQDGKVGIGTTAPDSNLHIWKATAGSVTATSDSQLVVENSAIAGIQLLGGAGSHGIIYFGDSGNNEDGRFGYDQSDRAFYFKTAGDNTKRLLIDSAGKVGIGNSAPYYSLDIGDDAHATGKKVGIGANHNGGTAIVNDMAALVLGPKGSRSGTANHYMGGGLAFNHLMRYNSAFDSTWNDHMHAYIGIRLKDVSNAEASHLIFATNNSNTKNASPTERMVIESDGNVGIGTTSPGSYKLYVNGTSFFKDGMTLDSSLGVGGVTTLAGMTATTGTFSGHVGIGGAADTLNSTLHLHSITSGHDAGLTFERSSEKATIRYSGGATEGMTIEDTQSDSLIRLIADDVTVSGALTLAATQKLYLDGGGDTYITESSANTIKLFTGGAERLKVDGNGITVAEGATLNGLITNTADSNGRVSNWKANSAGWSVNVFQTNGGADKWGQGINNGNEYYLYNYATSSTDFKISAAGTATFSGALKVSYAQPAFDLQQSGTTRLRMELDSGDDTYLTTYGSGNKFVFRPNSTIAFTINETSCTFAGNVVVAGTGRLGIGTGAASNTPLHIYTNSESDQKILVDNDGGGQSGLILRTDRNSEANISNFINFEANGNLGSTVIYSTIKSYIVDNSNSAGGTGRLTFTTAVNGTDTPTLHITGGKVGIGTTAPSNKLTVQQSTASGFPIKTKMHASADNTWAGYGLGGGNTTEPVKSAVVHERLAGWGKGSLHFLNNDAATAAEVSLSDVRMTIKSNGKVGIGVTDPDSSLEIKGAGASTGLTFKTTDSSGNTGFWAMDGGRVGVHYYPFLINQDHTDSNYPSACLMYAHSASPFTIKTDGKVGIGTTAPDFPLTVKEGSSAIGFGEYTNGAVIWLDGSNGDFAGGDYFQILADGSNALRFGYAGLNKVSMLNNGKVGIGTTNPSEALHVAGNMRLTGGFYDKNNSIGSAGNVLTSDGSETYWSASGSGTVSGTGTNNYIASWNGTTALEVANIYKHAYGTIINSNYLTSYATNRYVFEVSGNPGTGAFDGGIINLRATSDTNDEKVGRVAFINAGNANHVNPASAAGSKIAEILSTVVTTDSNAGDDSGGDLRFWTKPEAGAPVERMRIASNGAIGINQDPDSSNALSLKSLANNENAFQIAADDSNALFNIRQSANDCLIRGYKDGNVQTIQFHSDGDSYLTGGNVGIGTTPATNLHIASTSVPTLRIHHDSTSSAAALIQLMRGTTDTFGGDAYTDWQIHNIGGDLKFQYNDTAAGSLQTPFLISYLGAATFSNNLTSKVHYIEASGLAINLDTPSASQNCWITWNDDGTAKWEIGKNTANKLYFHNYTAGASALEFDTSSNATFGGNVTLNSANATVKSTGNLYVGTDGDDDAILITDSATTFNQACTFSNNLTVTGNLTVNGTTTTIDTTNLLIEDPLMLLAKIQTGTPTLDCGLIMERGTSTNVGFIWDESADEFALINTTDTATTAGNVTIASYAHLRGLSAKFGSAHNVSILNADVRQTLGTSSQGDWAWNLNTDNTFYVYDYNANVKRLNVNGSNGYVDMASASQVRLTLGSQGTAGTNDANWIRGTGTSLGFNAAGGATTWEVSGSEKMRLDAEGNLGVGTAVPGSYYAPAEKLVIHEAGDGGITVATGATSRGRLVFARSGVFDNAHGSIAYDQQTDKFEFYTSGTEQMEIWSDGTQNHNGNSIVNSASVQGLQDGAVYDFDGGNDYIQLTSDGRNTFSSQHYTVAGWIKLRSSRSTDSVIFSYDHTSHSNPYYAIQVRVGSTGKVFLGWNNGSSYKAVESPVGSIADDTWHHIACTYTSGTQVIYIDGVSVTLTGDTGSTGTITFYQQEVWIGKGNSGWSNFFEGSMRGIQFFPTAFGASWIRKLYNGENPNKNLQVEMVTDGNFDDTANWVEGTGWSIGSAGATHTGSASYITQTPITNYVQGSWYIITCEVPSGTAISLVNHRDVATGAVDVWLTVAGGKGYAIWRQSGVNLTSTNLYSNGTVTIKNVKISKIGTTIDLNSRSASPDVWFNSALPSVYDATITGPSLSAGSTDHRIGGDLTISGNIGVGYLNEASVDQPIVIPREKHYSAVNYAGTGTTKLIGLLSDRVKIADNGGVTIIGGNLLLGNNWSDYGSFSGAAVMVMPNNKFLSSLNNPASENTRIIGLNASNQVSIAPGSEATVFGGTITENSSIAIKENIFDLNTTLDKISKVRPVRYNKKKSKNKKEIGLIAEELAEIFPELVENDENGNPTSVNYTRAVTVLFDGFKQMYKELKEIKEKIK